MIRLVSLEEHFPSKEGDIRSVSGFERIRFDLLGLRKFQESDFLALRLSMRMLLAERDALSQEHVTRRCGRHRSIYEVRGGNARLMFFFNNRDKSLVICNKLFMKTDDEEEQDKAFDEAEELRKRYFEDS